MPVIVIVTTVEAVPSRLLTVNLSVMVWPTASASGSSGGITVAKGAGAASVGAPAHHLHANLEFALVGERAREVEHVLEIARKREQLPGAALWIERLDHGAYHRAYGQRAIEPTPEMLDEATVFDAASLTKPVVTATLVQGLRERGQLDIDAPLQRYLPDCGGPDKAGITLRQLLTHSSGLPASLPGNGAGDWAGAAAAERIACGLPLTAAPGTRFRYSDVNFILLGRIIERVSGQPLASLARQAVFQPLGMQDSGYLPLQRLPPAVTIKSAPEALT